MAAPTRTRKASGNKASLNLYTRAYWIPRASPSTTGGTDGYSAYSRTGTMKKGIGLLCTMESMDEIPFEAIETFDFLYAGKDPANFSAGKKIPKFEMRIAGADFTTLMALIGRDQGVATVNTWEPNIQYQGRGHILMNFYDHNTNAMVGQQLLMNMQVHFDKFAGMETSGERFQTVGFSSPSARVVRTSVERGEMINTEFWYHNGTTDTNATAPEATITAFVLGTGNGSYASATTPVALRLDSTNTSQLGHRQFLIEASVNGALVPISGTGSATFATSTLTFAVAPAALASLMVIYVCDPATYAWACFSADDEPALKTDAEYEWANY